jgi:hypothetical protein
LGHIGKNWTAVAAQMKLSQEPASTEACDDLNDVWAKGYSIAELWGFTKPVSRGESASDHAHLLLWGILSIVEYQVDRGAGHNYLRDRLWHRDWIAVGFLEPKTEDSRLEIMPPIKDAKFGRKFSAVGDGITNYTDIRIVHAQLFTELTAGRYDS